jgi:hypothetical protein
MLFKPIQPLSADQLFNKLLVLSKFPLAKFSAVVVKGGVKLDHLGGEKVDHFSGERGLGLRDLRGRLERRPATRFAGRV